MKHTLLMSCVVLAGCVDPSALDEPGDRAPAEPTIDTAFIAGERDQGSHILGSFADSLATSTRHFRVSVIPVNQPTFRLSVNTAGAKGVNGTHLVADDGGVTHVGADPWFVGLILEGPNAQLKIRRVESVGTGIVSTAYFLDYRPVIAGDPGAWTDYCGSESGGAIALAGYYDLQRTHQNSSSWISFACADGVARKCNNWGYIAGTAGPGNTNWDHHQACTGMANANYCGTGQSFTREKTPIAIRDNVSGYGMDAPNDFYHPAVMPGDPDTYYIEAGWLPSGKPLCLSKLRWAGLAPNQCGPVLPDPRFANDPEVRFCDDWTIPELFVRGALLVNGSKMMDAPLHRWRNAAGDEVSTIRGYYIDRNGDGAADWGGDPRLSSTEPFPGYTTHLGTDGMLLRNLPGSLLEPQMRPLYMQNLTAGGDRYLSDVGAGRADPSFEGYSFLSRPTLTTSGAPVAGLEELSLCHVGGDQDTRFATLGGCTLVKGLSYALPAP